MSTDPRPAVRMSWDQLLFLHWPVDPAQVQASLPEPLRSQGLEVDTFDGHAWISLVPFRMEDSRFRFVPSLPGLGSFYECNVRTYVRARGADGQAITGVWFYSLDAEHLIPVLGGRWIWNLEYRHAGFEVRREGERAFDYRLKRHRHDRSSSRIRWVGGDRLPLAQPGSLEHFLTERYWLFTGRGGRLCCGRVAHEPWPLRSADLLELDDGLVRHAGFEVEGEPLAQYVDHLAVEGFSIQRVDSVRS